MKEHKGKRLCITGIPTAGKSTLTERLAAETNSVAVLLDDFREDLAGDERYKKWVNFYLDQNQETYYTTTSPENQWKDFVTQSEALWPAFLEKIDSYTEEERPVIFECVNLLPHLIHKDLLFPTIVLIGSTYAETYKRNKEHPRWGTSEYEVELSSKGFFFIERHTIYKKLKNMGIKHLRMQTKRCRLVWSF
jgi:hypothetical protein